MYPERIIYLHPWEEVFKFSKYDTHTMISFVTLIAKDTKDDYYYFYDDIDKLGDISRMPLYIKEDWLNYNKKELNISVLNVCIKECKDLLDNPPTIEDEHVYQQQFNLLNSIRRDLIIKGIT